MKAQKHNKEAAAGMTKDDKQESIQCIVDEGEHVLAVTQPAAAASMSKELQARALRGAKFLAQHRPHHFSRHAKKNARDPTRAFHHRVVPPLGQTRSQGTGYSLLEVRLACSIFWGIQPDAYLISDLQQTADAVLISNLLQST
jgi:hypothetical protein